MCVCEGGSHVCVCVGVCEGGGGSHVCVALAGDG